MQKIKEFELDYAIKDFMIYCKQKDLRRKTMMNYESTRRLFARYLEDKDIVTINIIIFQLYNKRIKNN